MSIANKLRIALNNKANINHVHEDLASKQYVDDAIAGVEAPEVNLDNYATNESVDNKIAALIDGAPEAMNTIKALGDAINAHEDEYDALLEVVGNKAAADHVHDNYISDISHLAVKADVDTAMALKADKSVVDGHISEFDTLIAEVEAVLDEVNGVTPDPGI